MLGTCARVPARKLASTVEWTLARGWPGLENLALIPGTVGAAPIQNIGAYGLELADRFLSLEACDLLTGKIRRLDRAACRFAYRDSIFRQQGWHLDAHDHHARDLAPAKVPAGTDRLRRTGGRTPSPAIARTPGRLLRR